MQDYAANLLIRMVEIYSPSGEENRLANFLKEEMSKLGFRVNQDAVGNVIGRVGDGKPRILLCGHMDTIPSILPTKVVGDVLYGRGAVDAKAALATMIIAASQLVKEDYAGEILVVGAVDEEGKGRGVKHLVDEELDVDYAIFGEPTNVETVTIGYKGSLLLKIVCETETGHSSAPWLFENAVEKAIEIWFLIKGLKMSSERPESRFHSLSFCLRRIEGGGGGSVVPSRSEANIEIRIPPSITVEQIRKKISTIIKKYSEENTAVKVKLEVMDFTEPFMADKRSKLVKAFSRAIWIVRGKQLRIIYKTGTGDMNVFGNSTGKTTVTYGPGNSHLDHTPHEHVSLNDYLESIRVLKEALKNLYQLHHAQV